MSRYPKGSKVVGGVVLKEDGTPAHKKDGGIIDTSRRCQHHQPAKVINPSVETSMNGSGVKGEGLEVLEQQDPGSPGAPEVNGIPLTVQHASADPEVQALLKALDDTRHAIWMCESAINRMTRELVRRQPALYAPAVKTRSARGKGLGPGVTIQGVIVAPG
jgi:hypothetical protein